MTTLRSCLERALTTLRSYLERAPTTRRRCLARPVVAAALLAAVGGCTQRDAPPPYVPGLGEIMSAQQMRHVKLWLAAEAGNWDLVRYEIDELDEGFADAIEYHPTHRNTDLPLAELIPQMTREPIAALRRADEARDRAAFQQAFDALTDGCNGCHRATNFGFNVVRRPTGNPFVDQDFAPPPADG